MPDRLAFRHPEDRRKAAIDAVREGASYRKAAALVGANKSSVAEWHAKVRAQGELGTDATGQTDVQADAELDAEGQEQAQQAPIEAPDAIPSVLQHLTDPLYLQAFRRYVSAIANGTHHIYAVQTAQGVHPDFDVSHQDRTLVGDAVGRLMLSEGGLDYLMFAAEPPAYVKALYSDYAMDAADATDLAGMLLELKTRAYLAGINTQLAGLGRAPVRGITDPAVLSALRDESTAVAKQIAETWNRDAASAVGARWLEVAPGTRMRGEAVLTPEERRMAVRGAMDDWLQGRRDWKASMWANHQASISFNGAGREFNRRNKGAAETGHVEPYAAECTGCMDFIGLGEQPADVCAMMDIPAHPRCPHFVVYSYSAWDDAADGPLWAAQGDYASVDEGVA
jgi:transposase-like protein